MTENATVFKGTFFIVYNLYNYIVRVNPSVARIFSTMCLVSHNDEYVDIKD